MIGSTFLQPRVDVVVADVLVGSPLEERHLAGRFVTEGAGSRCPRVNRVPCIETGNCHGTYVRMVRRRTWLFLGDLYRMVDSSRGQLPIRFTGHRSRQPRTLLAVQLRQSPTPDVAGRVQVRVVFVRTAHAAEVRLRRSRAGIDVSARGAGLAGVPGIDRDQPRRLV